MENMRNSLANAAIVFGLVASAASAQSFEANSAGGGDGRPSGFQLSSLSLFSGYSSTAYPLNGGGSGPSISSGAVNGGRGGDATYGISAAGNWQHRSERTNFLVNYNGSYGGFAQNSDLNSFSQAMNFNASRQLGNKWTAVLSGSAQNSNLSQFLFQPMTFSAVTQTTLTFNDLAAAFAIGQFSNAQVASMLTGAPILQSPSRTMLLGDRVFSYAVNGNVNYAFSSRLSIHFASFAAAGQRRASNNPDGTTPQTITIPRSIGGNGGVTLSYALTPRTELSVTLDETVTNSRYQSSYGTTPMASIGRKMGEHWFMRAHAGAAFNTISQHYGGTPRSRQMVGGGALGFQTRSQTFVGSYDRSSSDSYGFAVGTNSTINGGWSWRHPGSRWTFSANLGQQQIRNTGFVSISGMQGAAGATTNLADHISMSTQYVFFTSSGNFNGVPNDLTIHSVRISVNWQPQPAYLRN